MSPIAAEARVENGYLDTLTAKASRVPAVRPYTGQLLSSAVDAFTGGGGSANGDLLPMPGDLTQYLGTADG